MQPARLFVHHHTAPPGPLLLVTDEAQVLRALYFQDRAERMVAMLRRQYPGLMPESAAAPAAVTQPLARYFDGDLHALDAVAWATAGTDFQQKVWTALVAIGPGTTLSYGALAARLGMPNASRAVGLANGANPVSIVVPCHRVIGATGALTGYGGGMARKQWLLRHEGIVETAYIQPDLFA